MPEKKEKGASHAMTQDCHPKLLGVSHTKNVTVTRGILPVIAIVMLLMT